MIDFTHDNPPTTSDERIKALRSLSRVERELGYVDERVSEAELPAPHFAGERYEAEVPETLELTDRALLAINAYTRMLDPAMDHRFYGNANFMRKPPVLIMGGGYECTSKQLESLLLMRIMTGSTYNADMDNRFMGSMLHMTARDGFFYAPWTKVSWLPRYLGGAPVGEDVVSATQQPFTSIWEEERQILALCMRYQQDGNPLWKDLIEKKVRRASELAVWKEDYCYFTRRFYVLNDKGPVEGPLLRGHWALWDVMFGVHGLSLYYRLTGYEPALRLAGGLVRRAMRDEKVFGEDGRWLTYHFHSNTSALIGILEYATTVDDGDLVEFVRKSYEFGKAAGDPLVGYYPEHVPGYTEVTGYELPGGHGTCETCEVADMLVLGVKLTRAGAGEYWDDVDRCVRNQFVENQITCTEWVDRLPGEDKDSPYRPSGSALQLWEEETDAVERAVGSWAGWALPNDARHRSLMQCCAGNAGRSMYYVWDSIVTRAGDEVRVNLHLNRASPWLDVESHLPYEGRVVLKVKQAPRVAVRIPDWTDRRRVTCRVNGAQQDLVWNGNYVGIGGLKPGDQVAVEFPMREVTCFRQIAGVPYRLRIKGNTVVDIDPEGKIYPLYQRDGYLRDKAPLRKVTRFVPQDRPIW